MDLDPPPAHLTQVNVHNVQMMHERDNRVSNQEHRTYNIQEGSTSQTEYHILHDNRQLNQQAHYHHDQRSVTLGVDPQQVFAALGHSKSQSDALTFQLISDERAKTSESLEQMRTMPEQQHAVRMATLSKIWRGQSDLMMNAINTLQQ